MARLRDKYWFLPALAALTGLLAGIALVAIDISVGDDWLGQFETLHGSRPEGARAMLSTIAGSTITVAGVVFSITLAAVTYASGQHGPRLLTNFARDRGNQLTLGVFIGTYVYCLIVLRTIRTAGEDGGASAFVPQFAVYGALGLALASIGVLIYFFHHVTDTIHINNVIARIARGLIAEIHRNEKDGLADTDAARLSDPLDDVAVATLAADRAGYVESIDHEALVALASKHDLKLCVQCRPGDFIRIGTPLLAIDAAQLPAHRDSLRDAFAIGDRRTDLQDLRFGFDELTEIAIRALSPGTNDPFTALACIDWLTAALSECERTVAPAAPTLGTVQSRVSAISLTFADFIAATFAKMRQHAATEVQVKSATLHALETLAAGAMHPANRVLLMEEHARLAATLA
ncbi:DUF2254 domain-containing protein [Polymorphobacter fuscus]|uniref:DUF2254 domain-containing protein n=1 Tax=Sandarakinorhabdus fusca TaxID=1439888 RepID=UPI0014313DF3|nr:DUF2254 domain-containing protein [Polymorphobacter fuscus]NJC09067.1 putative membrane protein [Polymorphobacter fuscus]